MSEEHKNIRQTATRALVESGLLIAMGFVLSYIPLWKLPMGGRVTLLSMLPILIIGLRHGPVWGLGAGFVYSILQFIQEPYFIHPFQLALDYLLPFTALGLTGFFRKTRYPFVIGGSVAILTRFLCHFLSGVIFYGAYAADYGFANPVTYSICYNGAYMLPEALLTLIVGGIAVKLINRRMKLF